MTQRLSHRQVGIVQLRVLPHKANLDIGNISFQAHDHFTPCAEVDFGLGQAKLMADQLSKRRILKNHRHCIDVRQRGHRNDGLRRDVAVKGYLFLDVSVERVVRPANDRVGLNTNPAEFLDRMLGGLGLQLASSPQVRYQCHVNVEDILTTGILAELPYGLEEG